MLMKHVIKSIFVLSIIFSCFSCQKEEHPVWSGEPDKVIVNAPGTLFYNADLEMWCISYYNRETRLSNYYHIVEMPDKEFSLEEGRQVLASGLCYQIPRHILDDLPIISGGLMDYWAGKVWYYIKVTDLNFDYRGFTWYHLKSAPRINIPVESLPEWLVAKINYFEAKHRQFVHSTCYLIAKGEWNEQIVYLIANYENVFADIHNEAGDRIDVLHLTYESYDNLSTSKNWVVIYECGDNIPYPILIGW